MDRDEIIETVLKRCGRQHTNPFLVEAAEQEIVFIQNQLEGGPFMPWFLLSDETELTYTAANRAVDLPVGFLREYEDFKLCRYDSTSSDDPYTPLNKDEFDILESKYSGQASGPPLEYAIVGTQIHLFPTPEEDGKLRWVFFEKEEELSDSTLENAWTEHAADVLIGRLGTTLSGFYIKDAQREAKFENETRVAMGRLLAFDEARKQAARDAQRGDRS